jgi:2'-5' RNA ligase
LKTALVLVLRDAGDELHALYAESYADAYERGIPLHVTLLFPWVPREALDGAYLERATRVLAATEPFEFELAGLAEFPGVLWAAPEPAAPIVALIEALAAEFPEFPPYEGAHDTVIPHATVAVVDEAEQAAVAARLRARLEPLLPARVRATEATLLEEWAPTRWRERQALPLGGAA